MSLCLFLLAGGAFAQTPEEVAATLGKLSAEEKSLLNKPDGANDRAKNYLRIAGARLQNTRTLLVQENFSQAGEQLQIYTALVLDAGRFLKTVKLRDKAHKTIEQGLKEQLKLLESVRREVSVSLMDAADNAIKIVKRVQLQALNGALGVDNVLKDSEQ